jgi:hypothetical protein
MQKLFLIYIVLFFSSCAYVSKRTNPYVDLDTVRLQHPTIPPTISVFLYADEVFRENRYPNDTVYNDDIEELKKDVTETNWFSLVLVDSKLKQQRLSWLELKDLQSLEPFFRTKGQPEVDYELLIYTRNTRVTARIFRNLVSAFTFTLYPMKDDYSYDVGFQLISNKDGKISDLIFKEDYELTASLFFVRSPNLDKVKNEPVRNLIKLALLKFKEQGFFK